MISSLFTSQRACHFWNGFCLYFVGATATMTVAGVPFLSWPSAILLIGSIGNGYSKLISLRTDADVPPGIANTITVKETSTSKSEEPTPAVQPEKTS